MTERGIALRKKSNETGALMVEAVIVYPIVIVVIAVMLMLGFVYFIRANMQSSLDMALMYYSHSLTDRYIDTGGGISANGEGGLYTGEYNKLKAVPDGYINIYSEMLDMSFKRVDTDEIKAIFESNYRFLSIPFSESFASPEVKIDVKDNNYFVYRELEAVAVQELRIPFMNFFGSDGKMEITVTSKVVVKNPVALMRTTDVIDYAVYKSGIDGHLGTVKEKLEEFINWLNKDSAGK